MEKDESDPRLSLLSTQWTLVFQAHSGQPELAARAQEALMVRYSGAVHRYLLGALRDADVASDLSQEFALRFLRGEFHRADPSRGRFRDFVKRSLRNLMVSHLRSRSRGPRPLEPLAEPAADDPVPDFDRAFLESWRRELMARAWQALSDLQRRTGQPYYAVLRCRVDHPELRSPELALILSGQLGRPISAVGVRRALLRARRKFVEFLLDEVRASLQDPTPDELERELIDLNLYEYCRPSPKRREGPSAEDDNEEHDA